MSIRFDHLLGIFIQIDSHASRTPLSRTNFRCGHASPEPLSNIQAIAQASKLPETAKKTKIFVRMSKFWGCHAKIRLLSKCRTGKSDHVSHLSIWMKNPSKRDTKLVWRHIFHRTKKGHEWDFREPLWMSIQTMNSWTRIAGLGIDSQVRLLPRCTADGLNDCYLNKIGTSGHGAGSYTVLVIGVMPGIPAVWFN
jgi:hypothetical protein